MKNLKTYILLIAACALAAGPLAAACPGIPPSFPIVKSDDTTFSIGKAVIWVEPAFAYLVAGTPGWNTPYPGYWSSPFMYDNATTIGHSAVHQDSTSLTSVDYLGTQVGNACTVVSDSDLGSNPFDGPAGQREVHTEMYSLDLTEPGACNMGFSIRGGSGMGVTPASLGEVEATGGPDFPASSFFKLFVEIGTPFGFPLDTLINTSPLMVVNSEICSLPPSVVYIHGLTPAVDVYFKNTGQRFGVLRMAGHQAAPGGQERCPDPCGYCPAKDDLTAALEAIMGDPTTSADDKWMDCEGTSACYQYKCTEQTCWKYKDRPVGAEININTTDG